MSQRELRETIKYVINKSNMYVGNNTFKEYKKGMFKYVSRHISTDNVKFHIYFYQICNYVYNRKKEEEFLHDDSETDEFSDEDEDYLGELLFMFDKDL